MAVPVANVHAAMPPTSIRTSILSPMQSKEWMLAGGGAQVQEQYMRRRIRNAGSDLPVLMTLRCVRLSAVVRGPSWRSAEHYIFIKRISIRL